MTTLDSNAIEAVADLADRASSERAIGLTTGHELDETVLARVLRSDERVELDDLEKYLPAPRLARGAATLHDPSSFAAYVTRLAEPAGTTVWADDKARRIVAVFDDHGDVTSPGWRDHTATLAIRVDPDWEAWTAGDGKRLAQSAFGEFLEDHLASIIKPPATVLMEIAMTLVAKRSLAFESSARLQSGDVAFAYREDTKATAGAKGALEIPEKFRIRVAPFIGADPVEVDARLRYRITGEGLALGYKLDRPDLREKEAFDFIVALVRTGIPAEVPLLFGTAPASLRTAR